MFAYKKMNFYILLILCSIKYISIEALCYTVLFLKSFKTLDLLYKISAKCMLFQAFCESQRFQGIFKIFCLSWMAFIISRSSFGFKFRRFEYYRFSCGSPII